LCCFYTDYGFFFFFFQDYFNFVEESHDRPFFLPPLQPRYGFTQEPSQISSRYSRLIMVNVKFIRIFFRGSSILHVGHSNLLKIFVWWPLTCALQCTWFKNVLDILLWNNEYFIFNLTSTLILGKNTCTSLSLHHTNISTTKGSSGQICKVFAI
jgi:hypothetical protein